LIVEVFAFPAGGIAAIIISIIVLAMLVVKIVCVISGYERRLPEMKLDYDDDQKRILTSPSGDNVLDAEMSAGRCNRSPQQQPFQPYFGTVIVIIDHSSQKRPDASLSKCIPCRGGDTRRQSRRQMRRENTLQRRKQRMAEIEAEKEAEDERGRQSRRRRRREDTLQKRKQTMTEIEAEKEAEDERGRQRRRQIMRERDAEEEAEEKTEEEAEEGREGDTEGGREERRKQRSVYVEFHLG